MKQRKQQLAPKPLDRLAARVAAWGRHKLALARVRRSLKAAAAKQK